MPRNPILSAWRGEEPLWRVFWLYGVLVSTIITAIFLFMVSREGAGPGWHQLLVLAFVPYTIWILVSVWRSAFQVRNEIWSHIARALTVAWAINATMLVVFVELGLLFQY